MPPGAEFAWVAFWRLHADRPHVVTGIAVPMGGTIIEPRAGRIPYRDIRGWAEDYGIVGSAFDLFRALVEMIDAEFMIIDAERAQERAARRR